MVDEFLSSSDFAKVNKYFAHDNSHNYVILMHGYHSDVKSMFKYAEHYLRNSYNVLIPHMRAHGKSQGKYIGMGASTAMNVSAFNPESVVVIIEDCGYSSIYDIFSSELKKRFNLPPFPLLDSCELITKLKASYDFHSINPVKDLRQSKLPHLFIHCEEDDFVALSLLDINYNNCASAHKEKLIVPHAGQGMQFLPTPLFIGKQSTNF